MNNIDKLLDKLIDKVCFVVDKNVYLLLDKLIDKAYTCTPKRVSNPFVCNAKILTKINNSKKIMIYARENKSLSICRNIYIDRQTFRQTFFGGFENGM